MGPGSGGLERVGGTLGVTITCCIPGRGKRPDARNPASHLKASLCLDLNMELLLVSVVFWGGHLSGQLSRCWVHER